MHGSMASTALPRKDVTVYFNKALSCALGAIGKKDHISFIEEHELRGRVQLQEHSINLHDINS